MPLLIVVMVLAYLITKTVNDAKTDRALAAKGIVSPRLQAKYGDGAKARTDRYGFADYLKDAWSDNWQQRTEARRAAREAAATAEPKPGAAKVSLRVRLNAAKAAIRKVGRKLVDPVPSAAAPAPVAPVAADPAPASGPDIRRCPDCGEPLTRTGTGWDHPGGPDCAVTGKPWRPSPGRKPTPQPAPQSNPSTNPAPSTTKPTRGAPKMTGEVANYETAVNELEELIKELQAWFDACVGCLMAVEDAKNRITDIQDSYRRAAAIAAALVDGLTALNLDATTFSHIGTAADALPASQIDVMLSRLEEVEAAAVDQKVKAEVALAAAEAALANLHSLYAEAHATVQQNLGGDSSFLGDGSGGGGAPAPTRPVSTPAAPSGAPTGWPRGPEAPAPTTAPVPVGAPTGWPGGR